MKTKEAVIKMIEALPAEVTLEDIQYHLYVLQAIQAGEESLKRGPAIPHEEVVHKVAEWLKWPGRRPHWIGLSTAATVGLSPSCESFTELALSESEHGHA